MSWRAIDNTYTHTHAHAQTNAHTNRNNFTKQVKFVCQAFSYNVYVVYIRILTYTFCKSSDVIVVIVVGFLLHFENGKFKKIEYSKHVDVSSEYVVKFHLI